MTEDARDLVDPRDPDFGVICDTLREFKSYGFDVNDPQVTIKAIATARHRHKMDALEAARPHRIRSRNGPVDECEPGSVVYYMRIGNRCKIGFTSNLTARLAVFNPEELLATEPGGMNKELERHIQFNALRTTGEWFKYEPPLIEHVSRLSGSGA